MATSKNLISFLDSKEYDPIELVKESPSLAYSIVQDFPEKSDEIYTIMIDETQDKFLDLIAEDFMSDTIVRRINKLKLTRK